MLVVAKILNMKDKLLQQIMAGLLYKKTVIWTDLKINPGASSDNSDVIYAAAKIVEVKEKIDDFLTKSPGYLPGRYNFQAIEAEEIGVYTEVQPEVENQEPQGTEFTELLEAVIKSNEDMETLIKDKFLFSKEKIQGFIDTNPVQATLREKVEELHLAIAKLEEDNRANNERLAEQDRGTNEAQNNTKKLDDANYEIER